jgi:hypothetical protein
VIVQSRLLHIETIRLPCPEARSHKQDKYTARLDATAPDAQNKFHGGALFPRSSTAAACTRKARDARRGGVDLSQAVTAAVTQLIAKGHSSDVACW